MTSRQPSLPLFRTKLPGEKATIEISDHAMNLTIVTALRIFLPFAMGYFLSYLYRVVNAVIATNLVGDLGIGPSALGLLDEAFLREAIRLFAEGL